jgi:hypothetical protein
MVIMTIMTMTIILIALFGTRDHIDSAIMLTGTITPRIDRPASPPSCTSAHARGTATSPRSKWHQARVTRSLMLADIRTGLIRVPPTSAQFR